jgi:DNA (cytosine-5)-methyltransferase 1
LEKSVLTAIDLFCGAGGITEGFKQAGFHCLYANDVNQFAIQTFRFNHPETWADPRSIESVNSHAIRPHLLRVGTVPFQVTFRGDFPRWSKAL